MHRKVFVPPTTLLTPAGHIGRFIGLVLIGGTGATGPGVTISRGPEPTMTDGAGVVTPSGVGGYTQFPNVVCVSTVSAPAKYFGSAIKQLSQRLVNLV
jgi:hypothetical protein